MPELDAMNPETPQQEPTGLAIPNGEVDHEGAMAKADLYKLANYSFKLFKKVQDDDQLEAWVQAKITKAADYIASVYHYLEYEMKFNDYGHQLDNSDVMNESQKAVLKNKLMEAKAKIKALKVQQAEKVKEKKIEEGALSGGERTCTECGGSGMVYEAPKEVPAHVKTKVDAYKRLTKATHAAHKRLDANNNGIPDSLEDKEVDEEFGSSDKEMKVGDKKKTRTGELTKTSTGVIHKNTSYADDGDEISSNAKSGKGIKTHAKSQSAAEKKDKAPAQKMSPKSAKTWGMKDSEKFDNRDKEVDETYGQGVYEAEMTRAGKGVMKYGKDGMKALAKAGREGKSLEPVKAKYNKYDEATEPKDIPKKGEKVGKEGNAFGKAVRDAKADGIQKGEKIKVGGKEIPVKEAAKPSAGLSAAKKSAVVKDAKAGKDIGKPGKGFDALAKKAGGGEKGKKIAAAAMWKNIKETTKVAEASKKAKPDFLDMDKDGDKTEPMKKAVADKKETVKESSDFTRMQEQMSRLNRAEKPALVENREVDQIRALTKLLNG